MDYEDVANISNISVDAYMPPSRPSEQIAHEILFSIFCLVGIAADSLIVYTILKFKRLYTVYNLLLVNWAIADIFSILVAPASSRLFFPSLLKQTYCIVSSASLQLHSCVMMFAILVCINWTVESYFKTFDAIVIKYYSISIGLVWFITLALISVNITECLIYTYLYQVHSHIMLLIVLIIYIGIVVILQISRAVTKWRRKPTENSGLMLNLATAFVACWFFGVASGVSIDMNRAFQLIVECLVFCSSVLNLTVLYFYNQDFQAHLQQVLKCSRHEYQESSLNRVNSIVRVQNGERADGQLLQNQNDEFLNC